MRSIVQSAKARTWRLLITALPLPQVGFPGRSICRKVNADCLHDQYLWGEWEEAGLDTGRNWAAVQAQDLSWSSRNIETHVAPQSCFHLGWGTKLLYPQHLLALGRQLSLEEGVSWGKAVFFRLDSFWKGCMAENHQLINFPGMQQKEIL